MIRIDQTHLRITALVIAGTGLFVVLTKFNVPQLNQTFFDSNPYAEKRDVIDGVMTWIFTVLAVLGVLIELISAISGNALQERLYSAKHYAVIAAVLIMFMVMVSFLLSRIGFGIAKAIWMPKVVAGQKDIFDSVKVVIENNGWRQDQLRVKDTVEHPQAIVDVNYKTAVERMEQMEDLLELPKVSGDLKERVQRLKPFFGEQ